MRLSRQFYTTVVILLVAVLWVLCAAALTSCAEDLVVVLLGPPVGILLALRLISRFRPTFWNDLVRNVARFTLRDLVRGATEITGKALRIGKFVQWRIRTKSCAVFALLVGLLWIRSDWRYDSLQLPISGIRYFVVLSRFGVITVGWKTDSHRNGNESIQFDSAEVVPYLQRVHEMQLIFDQAYRGTSRQHTFNPDPPFSFDTRSVTLKGRTLGGVSISFPYWIPVLLLSIAPVASLVRAYALYRRDIAHLCRQCAYDLTGNVSGVCPECGTSISNSPQHQQPSSKLLDP